MATIISNGSTTLGTASGFYRVEAANLGCMSATLLALTTTRYINTTFANAGNCLGIVLNPNTVSITDRTIIASLEEYQSVTSFNTGTERVNKVAHGLSNNDKVSFTTTGVLPTGITAGVQYYVINKNADDFQISTSLGGSVQALSGTPSGTWAVGVERATKTLTTSEIAGEGMTGTYKYRGAYFTPFTFTAGYAVDTTASKWRFRIGHGTGTGTWNLATSDATNPFYAAWCDTAATATNGDVLIVKDQVVVDASLTLGAVLGTGDAANGVSCVICSNPANPAPADVSLFLWDDTPAASYTLTVGGKILMAAYSGFRIGTSTNRIPIAQRAIVTFTAPTAGTATTGFLTPTGTAANVYGGFSSIFCYGEIPAYQYTTLASDAAVGQAHLITNDNVDWVNGNTVVMGKQNVQGQGDTTIYTISSVSGNDITLTGNVATNIRRAGGSVLKLDCHGIKIQNTGTFSTNSLFSAANLIFSGVDLYNQLFNTLGTTYYYLLQSLKAENRSQYLFQDVTHWTNSTSCSYLITAIVPPDGILMERCYGFRQMAGTANVAYYTSIHKSGRMTVKDGRFLGQYAGTISSAANIRLTVDNNSFENARASVNFFFITGVDGVFKNNRIFGSATTNASYGAMTVGPAINAVVSGNYYDNCLCAFCFGAYTSINCVDTDSVFGSEFANTSDIDFTAGAFPDYTFKSNTGNLIITETALPDMVSGSKVAFADFNDVVTNDKVFYTLGKTQRTNAALTDTNVHTTGGSALRFEPTSSAEAFTFSFDVPTGNIQNKTMTVAIWCKLNTAAYYASDYDMPRITVAYDSASTAYAQAAQSTDWQLLFVPITPLTTAGKINVTLSCRTDALAADRYVYWDDISILYPAGYKLDLGGLDIWDKALPVLPPIATVMSASDIWALPTSGMGVGTTGEALAKALKLGQFIGLS